MTGAVNLNGPVERARQCWAGAPPAWVVRLAEEAARTTSTATARRIDYSVGVVSQVIGNKYPGDIAKVEAAVRGALMGETVICPVLDEIGRDWCLKQQEMPRSGASALRELVYRACRAGCPHSRIKGGEDVAD